MGALALYIEDEGVPTSLISLVREHTEAMSPPRALWVPFMLGRPFGLPKDADFQRRVALAALRLFERSSGPVLEDFPEEAPDDGTVTDAEGVACPVNLSRDPEKTSATERLLDEIAQLQVWHDLYVKSGARSALGLTTKSIREVGVFVASWAEGRPAASLREGSPSDESLRHACGELSAFYVEAAAAHPGQHTGESLQSWFWSQTIAGSLFFEIHSLLKDSVDPGLKEFARNNLIPRAAWALRTAR